MISSKEYEEMLSAGNVSDLERLTALYGEQYRNLIAAALEFLGDKEPKWRLPMPMSKDHYVWRIIEKALEIRD